MTKRLKLVIVALLGFSAACSSVKNAPVRGDGSASGVSVDPGTPTHAIRVMYGVPRPRTDSLRRAQDPQSQMDPVVERPERDSLSETVGTRRSAR